LHALLPSSRIIDVRNFATVPELRDNEIQLYIEKTTLADRNPVPGLGQPYKDVVGLNQ